MLHLPKSRARGIVMTPDLPSWVIGLSIDFALAVVLRKMYDEVQKKYFNKVK